MSITNSKKNHILQKDAPIHNWYQFVLGYPPHLVQYYIKKFEINRNNIVLDPFCGTGTTPVECMKHNITNYGIDANPIACFASSVKTTLDLNIAEINEYQGYIAESAKASMQYHGLKDPLSLLIEPKTSLKHLIVRNIPDLSAEQRKIIPRGFISEKPLFKVLLLKLIINSIGDAKVRDFFLLALANLIVKKAGNIGFGPEIYVTKPKNDVDALSSYISITSRMIHELELNQHHNAQTFIINGDSRKIDTCLNRDLLGKIDCVITSPPYPNEKDYTRTTRLESVLLGFIADKKGLREQKEMLLRSNSRNIFFQDTDGDYVKKFKSIEEIAQTIENKRIDLNKTSGFEKMYSKIVRHYFGGMYLHLKSLKPFLNEGAKLAYVVGDQMSFFRINIPTSQLLAELAEDLDYIIIDTELWRTRLATATKKQLNENVLILENQSVLGE